MAQGKYKKESQGGHHHSIDQGATEQQQCSFAAMTIELLIASAGAVVGSAVLLALCVIRNKNSKKVSSESPSPPTAVSNTTYLSGNLKNSNDVNPRARARLLESRSSATSMELRDPGGRDLRANFRKLKEPVAKSPKQQPQRKRPRES